MRRALAALVLSIVAVAATAQNLTITPTTTYAAETGINSSAPATFSTQSDGNLGAGNVSKVDTHTLLYPGFNGKIYAHVVGWFGGSNHENIGYNSSDPAVVKAQLDDMVSRGIDGIVHVWYGPGSNISNLEAQAVMNEAPNHPGFTFAIMIDHGAIAWNSCYPSCSATQALTNLTTYVANTYFSSPSYLRINGRPVITEFDIDNNYSIDWNYVQANTPGNPIFLFQNNSGFTHTLTGGSYSWVMPTDSNYGLDYLANFYNTGMLYPAETTVGATYKGFNDTLASWSANRIMNQQCGQTWLSTFAKLNSMYNSTNQIPMVQLVTWDDYEEGTEIETGIDNCVTVAASMSGSMLNWAISGGSENTIDHYTVFISSDGQNLMSLGDFGVGTNSLDVSTFNPAAGTYTLYVKAVGKPSIANKMSNAVTLTVAAPTVTSSVAVTPNSGNAPLTVTATTSSTTQASNTTTATSSTTTTTSPVTTSSTVTMAGTTDTTSIDFGDGTVVSGASATHTYTTPGTYTVTATTTNSSGVTSQATGTVTASAVAPSAVLTLSATSGTAPATISASTASSTDPNTGGAITGSTVDWGDGTVTSGPSTSHVYRAGGTYTVKATVTDTYGMSSTQTQTVNISGAGVTISSPTAGSTPTSPVQIVATAGSGNGIASMITYVDDVEVYRTYTAYTNTSVALAPGSHHLVINSWDSNGVLLPQASEMISVPALNPTAALMLSATTASAPATITATASATDPNVHGTISSYSINWGDGAVSTGASASHAYASAGTYAVTATVTDNYGKSATAMQSVTIQAAIAPTAVMAVNMSGPTAAVSAAGSTAGSGSIASTVINWGDGTSTTTASGSHTYNKGGYYTITVTVTNSGGLSASTSQQVTAAGVVIWLPQPGATANEPVHIAATAYDSRKIAAMAVYLDNQKIWLGYVNDFDLWQQMAKGTHTIVINAWEDATGVVYQSRVTFTAK